jgi:hypothetical protein
VAGAIVAAITATCTTDNTRETLHQHTDAVADMARSVEATIAAAGSALDKPDIATNPIGRNPKPDSTNAITDMASSVEAAIATTSSAAD